MNWNCRAVTSLLVVALLGACSTAGPDNDSSAVDTIGGVSTPDRSSSSECTLDDDPGTVTVWHSMSGNTALDALLEFGDEVEQEEGIHVEFRSFDGDADTMKALSTTDVKDWPDVVIVSEQATRALLDSGRFLYPDECDSELAEGMLPQVAATYSIDGRLAAMPLGVSVPVLIYEGTKYRRAGLEPAHPPTTLADLLAASATIRDSGASRYGLVMSDSCGNYLIEQLSAQRGEVLGKPGNGHEQRVNKVDLTDPDVVADLTLVRDAVWDDHVKYIGPNPSGFDDLVALTVPEEGAVMTVHTSGALGEVISLFESGNFDGLSLGVAPLPGSGHGSLIGGNAMWLHDSGDPAQVGRAWRLLEYLYEPEHLADFAEVTGYVPVTAAAAAVPSLQQAWARHPVLRVAYDQVVATDVSAATAGLMIGPYADKNAVFWQVCDKVLDGGADVDAALAEATASLNYLNGQYEAARTGEAPPTTWSVLAPADPTEVQGRVRCESAAAVVGVWVYAVDGGSGWADVSVDPDGTTVFSKVLDRPGEYQLHVGCGGTSAEWASSYFSEYVTDSNLSFVCRDGDGHRHGPCDVE